MSRGYRFGLVGHNIAYSKSPSIFRMLAEMRDVEISFDLIDVEPDDLASTLPQLKELDGFSVTIPYKEAVLPYMDKLSEAARTIGAVNSVGVENGRLHGYNTDTTGFIAPLREIGFGGGRVLVLGTGGAARAIIYVLNIEYRHMELTVCGRGAKRVGDFSSDIAERFDIGEKIRRKTFDTINLADEYDLVVNCTPAGGATAPEECPLPDKFEFRGGPICYDLVYDPIRTIFLRRAERAGCSVIGGLSMLVGQAVESYSIWTKDDFDRDAVSREILGRLRRETKGDIS